MDRHAKVDRELLRATASVRNIITLTCADPGQARSGAVQCSLGSKKKRSTAEHTGYSVQVHLTYHEGPRTPSILASGRASCCCSAECCS
jgi:hypothetical protein